MWGVEVDFQVASGWQREDSLEGGLGTGDEAEGEILGECSRAEFAGMTRYGEEGFGFRGAGKLAIGKTVVERSSACGIAGNEELVLMEEEGNSGAMKGIESCGRIVFEQGENIVWISDRTTQEKLGVLIGKRRRFFISPDGAGR